MKTNNSNKPQLIPERTEGVSQMEITKQLLTEKEAARMISMSVSFLRLSRMTGKLPNRTTGPNWHKLGKSVRYSIADLNAFLEKNRRVMS